MDARQGDTNDLPVCAMSPKFFDPCHKVVLLTIFFTLHSDTRTVVQSAVINSDHISLIFNIRHNILFAKQIKH